MAERQHRARKNGVALAGALSNAAASRRFAAAAEEDRTRERGEGDDGERRPQLATEAARRPRRANSAIAHKLAVLVLAVAANGLAR